MIIIALSRLTQRESIFLLQSFASLVPVQQHIVRVKQFLIRVNSFSRMSFVSAYKFPFPKYFTTGVQFYNAFPFFVGTMQIFSSFGLYFCITSSVMLNFQNQQLVLQCSLNILSLFDEFHTKILEYMGRLLVVKYTFL